MRYHTTLFLLLAMTFGLGVVVGDNYAPISGVTTRTLSIRCTTLEAKIELLRGRVARLELESDELDVGQPDFHSCAEL